MLSLNTTTEKEGRYKKVSVNGSKCLTGSYLGVTWGVYRKVIVLKAFRVGVGVPFLAKFSG